MSKTATYAKISSTTLGSAQLTISFNSFSGYTDLICVVNMTRSQGGNNFSLRLNGDTGTNYSEIYIEADGSSVIAGRNSNTNTMRIAAIAGGFGTDQATLTINIPDYENSTTNKTVLTRYSQASTIVGTSVGLWRNTSAVTSLEIGAIGATANFSAGTVVTLYGIQAVN
jgi:hypothetical protein